MTEPKFERGRLVPKGELRVVDTQIERLDHLGCVTVTTTLEDEAGIRWKIRGHRGGPWGDLYPVEWPTNVRATYLMREKGRYNDMTIVADSLEHALQLICEGKSWRRPEDYELRGISAPREQ